MWWILPVPYFPFSRFFQKDMDSSFSHSTSSSFVVLARSDPLQNFLYERETALESPDRSQGAYHSVAASLGESWLRQSEEADAGGTKTPGEPTHVTAMMPNYSLW
jgi:hypothetical protein